MRPILCLLGILICTLPACGGGGGGDDVDSGVVDPPPDTGISNQIDDLQSLLIAPQSAMLRVGTPKQFTALGTLADGSVEDLTEQARWSTSDESLVTISNESGKRGLATVHADGRITLTATIGDVSTDLTLGSECQYPAFAAQLELGSVMPPVGWDIAFKADGSMAPFELGDLHCDEEVTVIIFVIGAGWCGACAAYAQRLSSQAHEIYAAGGRIVYVEFEDADYMPADSQYAFEHLRGVIGNTPGILAGDTDTTPSPRYFDSSGIIGGGIPEVIVVRRSDMTVIADQSRSNLPLPMLEIAQNPDRDWSNPNSPPFNPQCGPADEEIGEPNDTPAQATPLVAGTIEGGICQEGADFYQIDHEGGWEVSIEFSHAVGDLAIWVWDDTVANPGPLQRNGLPVGSDTAADYESFQFEGPALVRVSGYNNSSAPYSLTFRAF